MTQPTPIPVVLESRYSGDVEKHIRFVRAAMRDCLLRGEAPYASHALYTQPGVLRDEISVERDMGLRASTAYHALIPRRVFYVNVGWSAQLGKEEQAARDAGHSVELRELPIDWEERHAECCLQGKAMLHWGSDWAKDSADLERALRRIEEAADPALSDGEFRARVMAAITSRHLSPMREPRSQTASPADFDAGRFDRDRKRGGW